MKQSLSQHSLLLHLSTNNQNEWELQDLLDFTNWDSNYIGGNDISTHIDAVAKPTTFFRSFCHQQHSKYKYNKYRLMTLLKIKLIQILYITVHRFEKYENDLWEIWTVKCNYSISTNALSRWQQKSNFTVISVI